MKTTITLHLRVFQVELTDTRTGDPSTDTIVLERAGIAASAAAGLHCDVLIRRLYEQRGYRVNRLRRAERLDRAVDLSQFGREVSPV